MVELVDTLDSGSSSRKAVEVRVLSRAPENKENPSKKHKRNKFQI